MSRSLSTHPFFASRCVRAMALFAWLLLTLSSPGILMAGITGVTHDSMPAAMSSMTLHNSAHATAMEHHTGHCCGNLSGARCHCDAKCGSVLVPALPAVFGSVVLADIYVPMRDMNAPTLDLVPPLRPPAI